MWIWLSALAVLRVTSQFSLSKRQAGAWYSWSEWGPCSRSCGSGVEVRSRSCRSLRPGGVTDCLGPARMHRTCNAEDCPAGSRDFREVQCSKYDEHDLGGRYYKWTPFYGAPNTCELNCQPKGENFYFTQAATVIDGTPCEPDKPDICIEGVCRELGCDGQLESGRLRDACGVCDGDDSSCFPVHGAFTDLHLPNGYNRVLVIPNGATNIQVSEMTPSKNFLAVKSLHGEYYFNGGSTVDYGRVLPGAGTMLRYERGSDDGGVLTPEMVTSTGPTTEPLVIELLTHEMNRGIKYEYYLPHDRKIVTSGVTWSFGSWSECSAECDEGFQTRHVYCTEGNGMRPNVYCGNQLKPTANRTCNIEHCPAILRWREGPWEACSVTCGEGHQTRPIYCLAHSAGPAGPNSAQAPDQECKTRGLRRPENHRPCQGGPCTEWIVGEWQSCSAECGPGDQTREVTCGKRYGCDDRTMPARIQPCNLGPCRSPEWVFGPWSQCSAECGPGEQTREVTCGKRYGCDDRTMPDRIQPCNLGPCRSREWVFGDWSQCSAECGPGEQTREVTCGKRYGCDDRTMPTRIQPCNLGPCRSPEWVFTNWSQCSAECGPGEQTREVTCGKRYGCDDRTMPARIQPCNLGPCRSPEWVFADWSQCSAECGPGEQTREVTCGKRHGCDDRTMPARIQPCNLGPCRSPEWVFADWSQCSAECGPGEQTREVTCGKRHGCDDRTMPARIQPCNLGPCRSREWIFGDWSQCSAECGPGEQTREVTCGKRYGCDGRTMPARIQPCNLGPCRSPEWVIGHWSQCSAECGPGDQTREVTCGKRYGCDDRTMPARIQPCNLGPCRSPEWVFGDWSQCSVTCGKGTRMRSMTCQVEGIGTDRPVIVSNTECNSERMSQRIEECQGGRPCTNQIRWYVGPWGVCSVSCGGGMRKRQAICYDEEYVLQDSKLCRFQQRPRELEACNTQRCTLSQEVPSRAIPGEKAPSHTITLHEGHSHPNQPVVIPPREDCLGSHFGCCPDGITVARGPNNQGCLVPCNQTRYGCCADGMTPAKEVDRSDCPENKWSTNWRGSNQRLPSPMLVQHCQDSPYGCCPDGMSSALGYDEAGCLTVPQDKRQSGHGMCNLPNDPGSCQDFAVKWFFVPESSGCNRFWYGGCDGNGNRFETKEACMMTCGSQAPKIPLFNAEANQQRQASIDVQPLPSAKPWQEVERNRRPEHRLWIERGDPTVVEGQVGQTVELRCRAKGSHGLEREWLKDGKRLQNIRYMQFPNGSLQILMTTPDDAGIFTCKVSSGDLQEFRQVSLHFPGGLTITKPPGDLEILAGKRAEFPCTVSDKHANIIWTRNGVTLESGANHGRLLVSSDGTLVVQVVQDSDEGHYTCNAYAGSAAVSASAHLKVAPPVQAPTHNMTSPGGLLPFLAWGEHAGCVDRLDLANCKLIVQAKLCDNHYFTLFCCHSCARPQS